MEKQFIPYEEALALKELGFDEFCFAYFRDKKITGVNKFDRKVYDFHVIAKKDVTAITNEIVLAPLWQQVFDWFRDKKLYHCEVDYNEYYQYYQGILYDLRTNDIISDTIGYDSKTHKEAALACLKKLIEIVKNK